MPYTVIIVSTRGVREISTTSHETAIEKFENAQADSAVITAELKHRGRVIESYTR